MRYLPLFLILYAIGCDGPRKGALPPSADPLDAALKIGDPAPPLTVTAWLHGTPVELKPGTAYVVDFWATWCGPCLQAMPHLSDLANEYAPQGVVFITLTTADAHGNTRDAVEKYIAETGKDFNLHFAFAETGISYEAWMVAAGRTGIPCSIVVDKEGKIAFIGHPMELDAVLPKIAAGTWKGKADIEAIAVVDAKFNALLQKLEDAGVAAAQRQPPGTSKEVQTKAYDVACHEAAVALLGEMDAFIRENPGKATQLEVKAQLMNINLLAWRFDEAKVLAESILQTAAKTENVNLVEKIRLAWVKKRHNPDRKHIGIAVQAAELELQMAGPNDIDALLNSAESYAAAGNTAKFDEMAARARQREANSPERLQKVNAFLKSFQ